MEQKMKAKIKVDVDPLLNVNQVAEILQCGVSTVWRLALEGKIPRPIQIGGMRRWSKARLVAWLELQAKAFP
jgi:excisionase family DNA binding protein